MKLLETRTLEKGVYGSKFELTEISEIDQEMLDDRAGFVELNIAGDITEDDGSGGTTVLLAQGDKFIKFSEGMPILRNFSIAQYGDEKAQKLATAWSKIMTKRILDLVTEMRTKGDTFSGTFETPLP